MIVLPNQGGISAMLASFNDLSEPGPDDVRAEVVRICARPPLGNSPRLASFLRYVVDSTLSGQAHRIKGYTIGVEALGRAESFDPQSDPIVRVEAIRLRRALARYYIGEGAADTVVIELPRGRYVPRFFWRIPTVSPSARSADDRLARPARRPVPPQGPDAPSAVLPQLIELCRAIASLDDQARLLSGFGDPEAMAIGIVGMLDDLIAQLNATQDMRNAVEAVLDAVIRLHDAERGYVQLLDRHTRELRIYAQRGFEEPFLTMFARVSVTDTCACRVAMQQGRAVVIEDVACDPGFAPYRAAAAEAGFRAVQSTPLISSARQFVGVLSTHFANPHRPSRLTMLATQLYARFAADLLARLAPGETPPASLDPPASLPVLDRTGT